MAVTETTPENQGTLQSYGLIRRSHTFIHANVEFLAFYIDPLCKGKRTWTEHQIYACNFTPDHEVNTYAVSPHLNAYVTFSVFLTYGSDVGAPRVTPMRYRDMMVDNYRAARGDLKTWRYIGAKGIINRVTVNLMKLAFEGVGKSYLNRGAVEYTPDHEDFLKVAFCNPFTRGVLHLLQEYREEMAHAKIKRFVFISEGQIMKHLLNHAFGECPELHMFIELCRPGEEGYVEGSDASSTFPAHVADETGIFS